MNEIFPDKLSASAELEALKKSGLPVALYGDGWYAPYVREFLARQGLKATATFVDDGFTSSAGTINFEEARRRFQKFNIVVAFADFRLAEKKLALKDLGQAAGVYFFDVMGALLENTFDRAYAEAHKEQFAQVRGMFADEFSRQTYDAFINAKLGDREGLYDVWRKDQYFPEGIITLSGNEVFVDGGAYTGDTLLAFIRKAKNKYSRCYAFEPEPGNAAKLQALAGRQSFRDVSIIAKGLWSKAGTLRFAPAEGETGSAVSETGGASIEADTIDSLTPDATFIKLDVEGAELEALKGAAETIKRNRPKLAVCLYHKPGDLFEIPLYLKSLAPDYRFFLRQHQPVACELVLYAVI